MKKRADRFVVGIDGGGTRTRAAVVGLDGTDLGRAEGGPALVYPGSPGSEVLQVLREVAVAAMENAGVAHPAAALHAGLAGVGREWVREGVEAALLRGLGPEAEEADRIAAHVRVGTDSDAAFHAAFGGGPGLLVISGTGSIGWGRGEAGNWARVGGWGSLLGDEGSGYRIALDALRAAVASKDGRGERTALEPAILDALDLDTTEELVDWAGSTRKGDVAVLAPLVRATARDGDAVAAGIIRRATAEMERHLVVLLERLGPWSKPPGLALCGGLISPDGLLRDDFLEAIAGHPCRPILTRIDAARGAALQAIEALSAAPTPAP